MKSLLVLVVIFAVGASAVKFGCQDLKCSACQEIHFGKKVFGTGCAVADIVANPLEFGAKVTWKNETVWQETINVSNPPKACVKLPEKEVEARLCIQFSNLHLNMTGGTQFDGCAELSGYLVNDEIMYIKLGCFHVPL